ncbi:MAG TPA: DUF5682 family protein [Saprospiraceae bacterium]|nr:DUF5682 family protein [Saprospiraceae bacterium]
MSVNVLGIRHHGVGSARQVLKMLHKLKPDCILIEGPPEITEMLHYIGNQQLIPPVSIMVYDSDFPKTASFYPFNQFSPEWVAIKFAIQHHIPFRAIDLPANIYLHLKNNIEEEIQTEMQKSLDEDEVLVEESPDKLYLNDPMSELASCAGFSNTEDWWDYFFEQQNETSAEDHFEAVFTSISALREKNDKPDFFTAAREMYMRQEIRKAQNEMYENIAVICGAWHAPALMDLDQKAKGDDKMLKQLPKTKIKITCTWIPWTNERMAFHSGYGAGITSPGWYEHLWNTDKDVTIKWLVKVAGVFRSKDLDISSAHVIEATRLSEALAAMRNKQHPTLTELNEATLSVMCMGDLMLLNYINKYLTVADKIGKVPEDIPKVPLQEDFERTLKSLRLQLHPHEKLVDLDLRKDSDLQKSILFHRLSILEIRWANRTISRSKGTFKESWTYEWSPELMVALVDKAFLGNTLELAATAQVHQKLNASNHISVIAAYLDKVIPAELFLLIDPMLEKIHELSAISSDIVDLMKAIPPLAEVGRYGNVRKSDLQVIGLIVENLISKVNIGLVNGCYGLDEEHSTKLFELISILNDSIKLNSNKELIDEWFVALEQCLVKDQIHPIIVGCTTRLLLDANKFSEVEADTHFAHALSVGNEPMDVAFWLEGFLRGSGMILLYDDRLWNLVYNWVEGLNKSQFDDQLPFLRRSFSKFEFAERRQIGEKARKGIHLVENLKRDEDFEFDSEKGRIVLPILMKIMGVK